MVRTRSANDFIRVTTKNINISNQVTIANDKSKYYEQLSLQHSLESERFANLSLDYSNIAKDWANKLDDTVDGFEYSAKYYAEKTKDRTEEIKILFEEQIILLNETGNKIKNSLDTFKEDSLLEMNSTKETIINEISEKKDEYISEVTNAGEEELRKISETGIDTKQDKFEVGTGLELVDGVLSNTQTSANWGNITGNIEDQKDLKDKLDNLDGRIEDLTTSKLPNATPIGTPNITGSFVSNFSDSNYFVFPFTDISHGFPFDIYFSFMTSDDVTTQQNILDSYFGIALAVQNGKGIMALSSNGSSWNIGTSIGTNTLLPNTTYYVKYSWTGTQYNASISTDNQSYVPDMILDSSLSPNKTTIYIGGSPNLFGAGSAHPFKGTINFKDAKVVVNDIEVWNGYADIGFQTRANVSLSNLDAQGEAKIRNSSYHPPLLSCMWFDHMINDIQWLRADTFSWQSGDVYKSVYDKLWEEYTAWSEAGGVVELENDVPFARTQNGYKITSYVNEQAVINAYNSTGVAWYYILDEANKRFKLPRTKFGFEGLRTNVGDYIAESLPNIKGDVANNGWEQFDRINGAFYTGNTGNNRWSHSSTNYPVNTLFFDASRSSSTYQDNAPVQERGTQMYLYFYVGEYTREAIEQTAGLNTELFNNKVDLNFSNANYTPVDTSASNFNLDGKSLISGWGMPSGRFFYLTPGASGTEYIAPANGYVVVMGYCTTVGGYMYLYCNGVDVTFQSSSTGHLYTRNFIPVKKGATFVYVYENFVTEAFRFIYAEGAN